jgi:CheY-like chemotaxis protein
MDWLLSIDRFDLRARYGLASGSSSSGDSPSWHYPRNFTSQLRGTGRRRRVALEQFNPADGGELTSKEKEAAFDISSEGCLDVDDALILFVDDKPFNADLFVRVLRRCGYTNELVRVGDGVEALNFLYGREDHAGRDVGVKPRLILLDLNMPRMGGLETLRRLRADERTKLLPIIMLTASDNSGDRAEAYRLGINGYVDKLSNVPFPEMVKRIADYWLGLNEPAPT